MTRGMGSTKDSIAEKKKANLISGLIDTREKILDIAASLSPEKHDEVFLGTWSTVGLLAHLAGWDETNLRAAQEVLEGKLPSFYAEHDRDWASYNAKLVTEYGVETLEEQLALTRETHQKLLDFLTELPASEIWLDRGIRSRGWKVTIGRLLEVERSDEEEHYEQLKQFIEIGETS